MLVLSRKIEEKIIFPNEGITIVIVDVKKNGAVKIGIEAPQKTIIKREELINKEQKELLDKENKPKTEKV